MAPIGSSPTSPPAARGAGWAAGATAGRLEAEAASRSRDRAIALALELAGLAGLGLIAALFQSFLKLRLGVPGHAALLWLVPLVFARCAGSVRASATVASSATALGMCWLGGFSARWPMLLVFTTFWLVGPTLDCYAWLLGPTRSSRGRDWCTGWRALLLVPVAGVVGNYAHLGLKLTYGLMQSHQPRLGLPPLCYELVTYFVFGAAAGIAACLLWLPLLLAGRPRRARRKGASAFTLVEMLVVIAIIGVLAGLLLPTLVAARERGRRTACAANLTQLAQGLELYCGWFSDYFPSWHGYGSLAQDVRYGDRQGRSRVADIATQQRPGIYDPRVLGTCKNESTAPYRWRPGDLARCPINLGLLLTADALQDGTVMRCPSAGSAGPSEIWRKIGGTGRQALLYGYDAAANDQQFHVKGSYNYRNAAMDLVGDQPRALPFTRPQVTVQPNCPPFPTHRQQGGRALVSDSFDRPFVAGGEKANRLPGRGDETHKEGYNVLYGDGHVKWYGDPAQRIIWYWPEYRAAGSGNPDACHDWIDRSNVGAHEVWHVFDVQEGTDLPATAGK